MTAVPVRGAVLASWLITALAAAWLAGSVYRIPIQVSDSLEVIQGVTSQSLGAAFRTGLSSSTKLRPLKQIQTVLLLRASEALGGRFHLMFRGYHAAFAAALVLLFFAAARPVTWNQTIAFTVALTVLVGMHQLSGLMREAYPVNHFLLVAVVGLAAHVVGRTRGGWWADAIAAGCLMAGVLTLESGLLVWVVAVAGYLAGLRGISRRGLVVMTIVLIAYVALRTGYLHMTTDEFGGRQTGFGAQELSPRELQARFADRKWELSLYNSTMSAIGVVLSQPEYGVWTVVKAMRMGPLPPVFIIEVVSSLLATVLILWYARRHWRDPRILVAAAALIATAAVSYAYAKDEISSLAGVFYALAVYAAAGHAIDRGDTTPGWRSSMLGVLLLVMATGWACRAAGFQYKLQRTSVNTRSDWREVLPPGRRDTWPSDPTVLSVTRRLRDEAVQVRILTPMVLPRWGEDWWGTP